MIDANQVVTCLGNIPWLSDLPSHWKVVRSKRLFTVRKERAFPDDEQLSATQAYGVISQAEYERKIGRKVVRITQHLDKRAHVEMDDFVISMRSFQGGLERAWARGCIRSSYVVLQPAPEVHINYFVHLFKSHDYIRALQATSNFIRDGQDLNFRNFSLVDLPLPPMEEQIAIGRYLDHADRRIRRYIRAKRQLIALLNEQKQAIIHRAVTRGLDPNVCLKPSGVEWLGDVPEHWEVKRVKAIARIRYGLGQPPRESEDGLPLIRATNVDHGRIVAKNLLFVDPEDVPKGRDAFLRKDEIVIVRSGAYTADSAIIPGQYAGAVTGYDMVLSVFGADPCFVALVLRCPYLRDDQLILSSLRAAQPHLNAEDLGIAVVVLPRLSEQSEIVQEVNRRCEDVESAIIRAQSECDLLREYRTRLIADVVTGKLDVREAAAALPDELEAVEPDAEELLDEDETTDDVELDTEPEEVEA